MASGQEQFLHWVQQSCTELYAETQPQGGIHPCEAPLREYGRRSRQMFGEPLGPRLAESYGAYVKRLLARVEAMHAYTEEFIWELRSSAAFDARFGEDLVAPYTREDIGQLRSAVRVFEQRTDPIEGFLRTGSGGRLSISYNGSSISVSANRSQWSVGIVGAFMFVMFILWMKWLV